ncbi:serine/arginine-rich splicing factor 2-like [Camellia sinensis]|uniref:serine/arginine-rich splicing factor 2-like n=1 Tax=Camellia sinensis TaxID=4442 RepID=UPI0010357796|nr:serine/arginine-rich splicing factor 2-like [Camellia sinensis]
MRSELDQGGWNPVIRRRSVGNHSGQSREVVLITVFVDNIPESMDPPGLFYLFRKFGLVKDVFIPGKRRKATNSRFGFVRYDCEVAARVAIQKADGLWCGNKALRVKCAEYQKPLSVGQQKSKGQSREDEGRIVNRWVQSKQWKGNGV